ncbi:unnamed protein product [Lathyrus sativus]|nr:unnamed protein product [Lathyrus sativus]
MHLLNLECLRNLEATVTTYFVVSSECKCDSNAPLITVWTYVNSSHRFYGCGMYKIQGYKKCNHFIWLDEEINHIAKEVISTLMHNLTNVKQKVKDVNFRDEEMKMEMEILKK